MNDLKISYGVGHEFFWAEPDATREITIGVSARGSEGRRTGDFSFVEHNFGRQRGGLDTHLRLMMFDDTWPIIAEYPLFMAQLTAPSVKTLADVKAVLDSLGAEDYTTREHPIAAMHWTKKWLIEGTVPNAIAARNALHDWIIGAEDAVSADNETRQHADAGVVDAREVQRG